MATGTGELTIITGHMDNCFTNNHPKACFRVAATGTPCCLFVPSYSTCSLGTKKQKQTKNTKEIFFHKPKIHCQIHAEDRVPIGADSSGIPLQGVESNRILSGPVQSPPGTGADLAGRTPCAFALSYRRGLGPSNDCCTNPDSNSGPRDHKATSAYHSTTCVRLLSQPCGLS
jgi:hypothetical protein